VGVLKRSKTYKSIYKNHEEIKTLLLRNPKIADKEIENMLAVNSAFASEIPYTIKENTNNVALTIRLAM
jgi:hypothetical protein